VPVASLPSSRIGSLSHERATSVQGLYGLMLGVTVQIVLLMALLLHTDWTLQVGARVPLFERAISLSQADLGLLGGADARGPAFPSKSVQFRRPVICSPGVDLMSEVQVSLA
jgi:hypothetical protein